MKKNLLVVEDDSGLRRYFVILLEQMGYNVTSSPNGADALSLLTKENDFHLVITDLNMPIMTGIEMIEEIGKKGINIPVCAVSGLNDDTIITKLKELGCKDFLRKPVSCSELTQRVRAILERGENSRCQKSSA